MLAMFAKHMCGGVLAVRRLWAQVSPCQSTLSASCLDVAAERDAMQLHVILRWCTLVVLAGGLVSCQLPNRYLIYPHEVPPQVQTWAEDVDKGALRLHLEWARPEGAGPFGATASAQGAALPT